MLISLDSSLKTNIDSRYRLENGTYVGKNELNEQALRWKFCMKQNNHVLGSLHACLRPSIELTGSVESPTRSRSMRACASSRSSGLSQEVVKGVLGRRKKPKMATRPVTAPSLHSCVSLESISVVSTCLHDEQPSPTSDSVEPVHACEDAGCDEAGETGGEYLGAIK